jgi:hypothetical protein
MTASTFDKTLVFFAGALRWFSLAIQISPHRNSCYTTNGSNGFDRNPVGLWSFPRGLGSRVAQAFCLRRAAPGHTQRMSLPKTKPLF